MADAPKKDLTGIIDVAKALEESGNAPPLPEGSVMEASPIEPISDFESLDEYAKHHPPAEPPALDLDAPPGDAPIEFGSADFPVTPDAEALPPPPEEPGPGLDSFLEAPSTEPEEPAPVLVPMPEAPLDAFAEAAPAQEPAMEEPPPDAPDTPLDPPLDPPSASPPQKAPPVAMEQVRRYSEQMPIGKPSVAAAFPFSLSIEGALTPEEKEKLLDVISRHSMGFSEMDLEPQLASDRILIPRISEFAGVLLVQALRGTRARMSLGPSDTIFSTDDTRATPEESGALLYEESSAIHAPETGHEAESLPITNEPALPGGAHFQVIDVVTASATLRSQQVEAERSSEYQEVLEALQRELKFKAFRRGADAIVGFQVQLLPLSLPTQYRLQVSGSAVRIGGQAPSRLPPRPPGLDA